MRSVYTIFTLTILVLTSCEADQKIADKMAIDVCEVLSKYNENDSKSILDAATGLERIHLQEVEYSKVSSSQLQSSLENNCPHGFKKYIKLNP